MQNLLCKNLRHLRKLNKLTQADFAQKLGIKRSTYAYWEKSGVPNFQIKQLSDTVFKEFGVTLGSLIDNDLQTHDGAPLKIDKKFEIINEIDLLEQKLKEIREKLLSE